MDPRPLATGWEAGDERRRGPEAAGGKRGAEAIRPSRLGATRGTRRLFFLHVRFVGALALVLVQGKCTPLVTLSSTTAVCA